MADKGRFCSSCKKTVIDFTALNDRQIIEIFAKSGTNTLCGRFLETQVGRELAGQQIKSSFAGRIAKIAAAMGLLFQSVTTVTAQQSKSDTTVVQIDSGKKVVEPQKIADSVVADPGLIVQIRQPVEIHLIGTSVMLMIPITTGYCTTTITKWTNKRKPSKSPVREPRVLSAKTLTGRLVNYWKGNKPL